MSAVPKMVSTLRLAESLKLASQLEFGRVPLFVETYCNEARKALEPETWLALVARSRAENAAAIDAEREEAEGDQWEHDAEEERARQFPRDEDARLDNPSRW